MQIETVLAQSRLGRLLRPQSIAVVGGGFFAPNVVKQSLKMGYAGAIWPIHPSKGAIEGVPAYRSIADLPAAPDAVFVGVNRHLTIEIVKALRERGAGGAICFAAGFRETAHYDPEGSPLQDALVEAAGAMPILGPNCYGLINYADGALLWPDQHGGRRLAEGECGVAIITQSSNIACNLTMQTRGLPVAFLMTAGNQAQTGISEMALGLIEDPRVSCLGLHIEGFDSVAGFEWLATRGRELGKPIVAMKAGRSEAARAATVSHTASLAGSDAASDAFLKRIGIARVDTIPSFLEALKLLHGVGPLGGHRLSSMSCSGGEASVMSDSAEGRKVFFPALAPAHKARVQETLGPLVAVANPLDYNTYIWGKEEQLTATFSAMVSGGFDLNVLVLDFPRTDRCSDVDWWPTVKAFEVALKANNASGAVVTSMGENIPEAHAEALFRRGIVPLLGIPEAMDAAEAAAFVGESWSRAIASPIGSVAAPPSVLPDISPSRGEISSGDAVAVQLPDRYVAKGGDLPISPPEGEMSGRTEGGVRAGRPSTMAPGVRRSESQFSGFPFAAQNTPHPDEAKAKALLAKAGVSVPPGRRASTVEDAVSAAESLGVPVALKAMGVAHKSEAGAVRLNLGDAPSVREAASALLPLGTGLYVERMVQGGVAELLVGFTRDPLFGPVMTLGSGGVLVELLQDSATLLLPASRAEIETALRGLKLFPLLDGFRGRPKADLTAAILAIEMLAGFVSSHAGDIEELDVNPLIVCVEGQGAWAADALIVRTVGER